MAFYNLDKYIKLPSKSVPISYSPTDCEWEFMNPYILKNIRFYKTLSCFKCGREIISHCFDLSLNKHQQVWVEFLYSLNIYIYFSVKNFYPFFLWDLCPLCNVKAFHIYFFNFFILRRIFKILCYMCNIFFFVGYLPFGLLIYCHKNDITKLNVSIFSLIASGFCSMLS